MILAKNQEATMEIELDGKRYRRNGSSWYEAKTFLTPPLTIVRQLDRLLDHSPSRKELGLTDVEELLRRAHDASLSGLHGRVEALARRALKVEPGHLGALAVLSSALRAQGRARQALKETEPWSRNSYGPLLTSRAAALCDIGQWAEAKRVIGRVLAMGPTDEAWSVMRRIKAARPDLYR
jgi:tetratricopeptide (TPR) repeat protein